MDIEWAKDGITGKLYIVQARPETVKSRAQHPDRALHLGASGEVLSKAAPSATRSARHRARGLARSAEMERVQPGDVLVADMTDPDWEPIMKRASAIVTNRGGRTCHAAIIARELGVPAVVGCGDAPTAFKDGADHRVLRRGRHRLHLRRRARLRTHHHRPRQHAAAPLKIMMNVGNPDRAFDFASCRTPASAWRAWSSSSPP
jgi:pyruvate,water dikinase